MHHLVLCRKDSYGRIEKRFGRRAAGGSFCLEKAGMMELGLRCPDCKTKLKVNDTRLGLPLKCPKCSSRFVFWLSESHMPAYPDSLNQIRTPVLAKLGLPLSFESPRFTEKHLRRFLTLDGTKQVFLSLDTPLLRLPGKVRSNAALYWNDSPVTIFDRIYLMYKNWNEKNRERLIFWLRQMDVPFDSLFILAKNLVDEPDRDISSENVPLPQETGKEVKNDLPLFFSDYPADSLKKIDTFSLARAGLPLSFESSRFTREYLEKLLTADGTQQIFRCVFIPLLYPYGSSPLSNASSYWEDPVTIFGESYRLYNTWDEYTRRPLVQWLRQMEVSFNALADAVKKMNTEQKPRTQTDVLPEEKKNDVGQLAATLALSGYLTTLKKTGVRILAKVGLPLSFQSPRFTEEHLKQLLSKKETRKIFCYIRIPLLRPVNEANELNISSYWKTPVTIFGQSYLLYHDWDEQERGRLVFWLYQMKVDHKVLLDAVRNFDGNMDSCTENDLPSQEQPEPEEASDGDVMEFSFSCSQCGEELTSDELHLLLPLGCPHCGKQFSLNLSDEYLPVYDSDLNHASAESIAEVGLPISFRSQRFTKTHLSYLTSPEGTKKIFPELPLPLLCSSDDLKSDTEDCYGENPVTIFGRDYLLYNGWNEGNRERLIFWLRQMNVKYRTLRTEIKRYLREADSSEQEDLKPDGDTVPNLLALLDELIRGKEEEERLQLEALTNAVLREFPNGFQFRDSSVLLLEKALERSVGKDELKTLKARMMKRDDGMFLLPEMVASSDVISQIAMRIQELSEQYSVFSPAVLFNEFEASLHCMANPMKDFSAFLQFAVFPQLPMRLIIAGKRACQICFPDSMNYDEAAELLASRVHDFLQSQGDAVLIENVIAEFPYCNQDTLEKIVRDCLPDTVEISSDDLHYRKLIEFFYLPDDFQQTLSDIIHTVESQNRTPSMPVITAQLNEFYQDDIRETYALQDESVYRQVLLSFMDRDIYQWNNKLLVRKNDQSSVNVADEFLQTQSGIFHESDFFQYAEEHRGLKSHGMLITSFLRHKCVRLDKTHWISLKDFNDANMLNTEVKTLIKSLCEKKLMQKRYLSIGTLPNAFFSEIPSFQISNQVIYWNDYLLTSVIHHFISELFLVNDEPSPYTVTAMIIPKNSNFNGDIIDYIFDCLKYSNSHFNSVDEVFNYLSENHIRMVKTQKLASRISDFLEENHV